ncbi:MAG: insulinase family protein [Candidatus Levybacteria bacterium]|nr:insulinase family protein [Candidatus Levybacteria bacterium]
MKHTLHTLSNGLRVILVPISEMASATTLVMVGAGSRYETKDNSGVSHFLEHMAFKGTKNRPTAREISSLIDGIGAESNAFTSKEITGYYIKSSYEHVDLALDVLSDMLSNLLLDPEEIKRESGVILEEINLNEDTPTRKIGDIFEHVLYGDTPMGWDITGDKETVKKLTQKDFIDYMKSLYSADNMTVVVAGKFEPEKVLTNITLKFGTLPTFKTITHGKATDMQNGPVTFIKQKNTEQAHFALGVRTIGMTDKKEELTLEVLASILGGGMSSRLFHEVREKRGLAYYARCYSENYKDVGYLAAFAGVDKNRMDEAIKVVRDELLKVCSDSEITQEELIKAKEYLKGHFILDLEDTRSVSVYYASDLILKGEMENPEEVLKQIDEVTLEDVKKAACKYIKKENMNLVIIGDFEDRKRFEDLLS